MSLTSPLTGAAVTGLTSPTFTLVEDTSPPNSGPDATRQFVVSALGGTQTGVAANSVGLPFSIAIFRPGNPALGPLVNPTTGLVVPGQKKRINTTRVHVRKGVWVATGGQSTENLQVDLYVRVPAGSEANDPQSIRSAISAMGGVLADYANELANDVVLSGIIS